MLNTETSKGAVHIARRMQANPREILISTVEANEGLPKEKLFDLWSEEIVDDEEMQRAVRWYFFINMYSGLTDLRTGHAKNGRARPTVAEIVEKARKIVLMDLVLANGKTIKDSTFAELGQCGGWLVRVSKLGKPNQIVGKSITEDQLRKARL